MSRYLFVQTNQGYTNEGGPHTAIVITKIDDGATPFTELQTSSSTNDTLVIVKSGYDAVVIANVDNFVQAWVHDLPDDVAAHDSAHRLTENVTYNW